MPRKRKNIRCQMASTFYLFFTYLLLQVLTDGGEVVEDLDAYGIENVWITDAGELEELGSLRSRFCQKVSGGSVERKDLDNACSNDDLPPGEYVVPDGGPGSVRGEFDARCLERKCRLRPEDLCDLWIGVRVEFIEEPEKDGELTRCSVSVNQFVRMLSTGVR